MKSGAQRPRALRANWSRDGIKRYLVQRFYTRFHMSLILASSALAAMLCNWSLLHGAGVRAMWVRYPVAVALSYLCFLAGVWLWLRYVGLRARSSSDPGSMLDGIDGPDITLGDGGSAGSLPDPVEAGGGEFGGGGASGSFGDGISAPSLVDGGGITTDSGGSGGGFSLPDFGDLDGDGIVLLLLALAFVAAIFLASGYIVWFAPDILGEALFGATLAAGLSGAAQRHDSEGWVAGVVAKTWWPFAIVLALAQAVAVYAAFNYPAATTLRQAVMLALE